MVYEQEKHDSYRVGLSCLTLGISGLIFMGNAVLETHGIEAHLTKKGKQESDAESFAIERLTHDDLTSVSAELHEKQCTPFDHWNALRLVDVQLNKLNRESASIRPA